MTTLETTNSPVITSDQWLEHWLGHRRLTRKTIEAFPEDKLFSYSIGGMRPFAQLAMETIDIALPGMEGLVSGKWEKLGSHTPPKTKSELLSRFDQASEQIEKMWPEINPSRFQEKDIAFDMYDGVIYSHILYFIENEIHHRGQGYVYLRSLGIEPPFFWER